MIMEVSCTWWYFLIVFLQYQRTVSSDGFNPCCANWQKNAWYDSRHRSNYHVYQTDCSGESKMRVYIHSSKDVDLYIYQVNFQPKDQFGILVLSFCEAFGDDTSTCYVAEIFGLVSGRLGYFWRRHSLNETGEERWVPGKKHKLPSTLLKSDVRVTNGTWDPNGKTVYQFYVELQRIRFDQWSVVILYNGGTARQQKDMTFVSRIRGAVVRFAFASYYKLGKFVMKGVRGCPASRRMQLKPGQDLLLRQLRDNIGIAFCTDLGQNECYVLEIYLFYGNMSLSYLWKRHSVFEDTGEEDFWVPGKSTKIRGAVLAQGEAVPNVEFFRSIANASTEEANKFLDEQKAWYRNEFIKRDLSFLITKTFDEKLVFEYRLDFLKITRRPFLSNKVTFDLPNEFQSVTVQNRLNPSLVNHSVAPSSEYGPCYNGHTLGYIGDTCNHQIPIRPTSWPEDKGKFPEKFPIFSPRPGREEAELVSGILESKAVRKTLCMSLLGIASPEGAGISVTAQDATGKSNATINIGQLSYNNVYPPEWQRVRLSANLPPSLQNAPLIIKLKSKRPTADSVVLLSEAKLCSYDGCGLPTAEATPFIAYGVNTSAAKYPWHVAVFKAEDQKRFEFICGGTLIRSDAVLSAAHCFVDGQNKLEDKQKFKLTVGKKYNSLFQFEPNQQFSDALDIKISSMFNGLFGNYAYDIALIQVSFKISSLVLPVCLNWFKTLPTLQAGDIGEIAGWGEHENGHTSRELFFAQLPFIPYDECVATVPETFRVHVTQDKFCAGNVNGSSVRKGDSGGGLVFNTGGLWYLRGIVSTGVPNQLTYSTFTDVVQFIPWIKKNLNTSDFD